MKYLKNKYYNVDKIITRKIKRGQKFYLIKWKGFPLEYCSWEPISHLTKILNVVEIFDNNFPKREVTVVFVLNHHRFLFHGFLI